MQNRWRLVTGLILCAGLILGAGLVRGGTVNNCTENDFLSAFDGDPILFNSDCTITLSQLVEIDADTSFSTNTIIDAQGHNVTINGGSNTVFLVTSNAQLTLKGITLTGAMNSQPQINPGAATLPIGRGGAICMLQGSFLLVSNCVFNGNVAAGTNGLAGTNGVFRNNNNPLPASSGASTDSGYGGAIYNLGSAQLYLCQFLNNQAAGGNGGNGGNGGPATGIYTGGTGGSGGSAGSAAGGAIYSGGFLYVFECTFSGNSATGGSGGTGGTGGTGGSSSGQNGDGGMAGVAAGGAIYSVTNKDESITNLVVSQCTFDHNSASGGSAAPRGTSGNSQNGATGFRGGDANGGAIFSQGVAAITNSTFFQDTVTGGTGGTGGTSPSFDGGNGGAGGDGNGGGIYSTGKVAVVNCTVTLCNAFAGTNGAGGAGGFSTGNPGQAGRVRGGGLANAAGTFSLFNTIIATNLSGLNYSNFVGANFIDGGYNLSSDSGKLTNHTSYTNTDARISTLSSNGGPTFTIALLANSPALDKIPAANCPPVDQRGFPRPINVLGDIGAYEFQNAGPPVINTIPTNTPAAAVLGSVVLSSSASGATPLRYQWRLFDTNLPAANTAAFTVTNVSPTNAGPYVVVVTNKFGAVTSSPPIFVLLPPFFTMPPTNQSILVGQPVDFEVQVSGNITNSDFPDPYLYFQWTFNGVPLADDGVNIIGSNSTNLFLLAASTTNAGPYQLVVTNLYGTNFSQIATLTVNSPPTIKTQPTNATVQVGGTVTFVVTTFNDADPTLHFQWQFYGTNLLTAQSMSQTFTISPAQLTDAGPYDVVAFNNFGNAVSKTVTLTVLGGGTNPPPPSPAISATFNGTNLSFAFQSATNAQYVLQYKNSLADPSWISLQTNIGTGGQMTITAPATNNPARFYRMQVH